MKKDSYEKLNDWFVNIYEQWIFMICYEKSVIVVSEMNLYRLFPNINKKTWFVFLELWFPIIKFNEMVTKLENKWYKIRIIEKN